MADDLRRTIASGTETRNAVGTRSVAGGLDPPVLALARTTSGHPRAGCVRNQQVTRGTRKHVRFKVWLGVSGGFGFWLGGKILGIRSCLEEHCWFGNLFFSSQGLERYQVDSDLGGRPRLQFPLEDRSMVDLLDRSGLT